MIKVRVIQTPSLKDYHAVANAMDGYFAKYGIMLPEEIHDRIVREFDRNSHAFSNFESLQFAFFVDGVSRACTHQLVRTRIGALS